MNCIFCHEISDNSKSIEHIVPESLGNRNTVLWKGAVCDKCNNYFATKIEKGLLEQPYFISVRHRNVIKTKKNRTVPQNVALTIKGGLWANALFDYNGNYGNIYINNEKIVKSIITEGRIIEPIIIEPEQNNYIVSRFLAKCAYEYLVFRTKKENFIDFSQYLKNEQFEPIRKYARYGEGCKFWPYYQRRIYGEGDRFIGLETDKYYEILNEMDFLTIELDRTTINNEKYVVVELYFILVIMGIEYAIHIAEPDISGYELWLQKNNFKSPVERYGETRIPNESQNTPQITESLIKKIITS